MRLSESWEDMPCISAAWGGPDGKRGIHTSLVAGCMNDLDQQWRLVARRENKAGWFTWEWQGEFATQTEKAAKTAKGHDTIRIVPGHERIQFLDQAFPDKRSSRRISTVQGRDDNGTMCLYARWWPRGV